MAFEVEFTPEFGAWWDDLNEAEQESVAFSVELLEERGPQLGRPHADVVRESRYANMKELRCQHQGRPYRILFALDPRRTAILLLGGDKTGKADWYRESIPKADALYRRHLNELRVEGLKEE